MNPAGLPAPRHLDSARTAEKARQVRSALALVVLVVVLFGLRIAAPKSFAEIRLADLQRIRTSLEAYRRDHGAYPGAMFSSAWVTGHHRADWIPGLVPKYLSSLPEDPRGTHESAQQYL